MKRLRAFLFVVLAGTGIVRSQSTFENLDFESAQLVFTNSPLGHVIATDALPGWDAWAGTTQLSTIPYNTGGGFAYGVVELVSTGNGAIDGNFSILLSGDPFRRGIGAITQSGVIPDDVRTLLFKVEMVNSGVPPVLFLQGQTRVQNLPYTAIFQTGNYTLYGADISAFAGQTANLELFASIGGISVIDDIQFSSQPIPEPSASALLFLASGVLVSLAVRRSRVSRTESGQ